MEELLTETKNDYSGQDLLATLEQRWRMMADTIRRLRTENSDFQYRLQDRDARIQQIEEDVVQLRQLVQDLQNERARTIARIEALLASSNELD